MNQHRNDGLPGLLSCWLVPFKSFQRDGELEVFFTFSKKGCWSSAGHAHIARTMESNWENSVYKGAVGLLQTKLSVLLATR